MDGGQAVRVLHAEFRGDDLSPKGGCEHDGPTAQAAVSKALACSGWSGVEKEVKEIAEALDRGDRALYAGKGRKWGIVKV